VSACLYPTCRRILSITAPSVMNEMIRIVPPQRGHSSGSSCQTCRMSFAHLVCACFCSKSLGASIQAQEGSIQPPQGWFNGVFKGVL